MTNFTTRLSGIATLALGALPMLALSTAAHAATSVKVSDLNLLTAEGVAAYEQRAEDAGRQFCRSRVTVRANRDCREGVREEMTEKMASLRQAQLAQQAKTFAAR